MSKKLHLYEIVRPSPSRMAWEKSPYFCGIKDAKFHMSIGGYGYYQYSQHDVRVCKSCLDWYPIYLLGKL